MCEKGKLDVTISTACRSSLEDALFGLHAFSALQFTVIRGYNSRELEALTLSNSSQAE
jgi:hypothetical protein